ncbi:MAG: hypothetical protein ACI4PP_06650 [Clostridia bacterium]
MTLSTVLLFCGGIVYGIVIGFIGMKLVSSTAMKAVPRNEKEARVMTRRITVRWWLRLLLDTVALFVLFHWVPMMLGAALGILVMQKLFIIKSIKS